MNHLVVDVAREVNAERLRQARTAHAHRTTHLKRSTTMSHTVRLARVAALVTVAFVLAFGSTAWAGKLVTGKQVKNGSLTSADVRRLSGADVADGSVTPADLARVIQGPAGPRGQEGASGPRGPQGPPGDSLLTYVIQDRAVPKTSSRTWIADCPDRTKAIGGGFSSNDPTWFFLQASGPDGAGENWVVTAENTRNVDLVGFAWAVCAATS